MIRGNLATRPFYNERPIRLLVALLAVIVAAATVFNVVEAVSAARRDSSLQTAAAQDEARARDLQASADRLRATVDPAQIRAAAGRAREANELIDRRTFSWTELFNRLETTLPSDVRIMSIRPQVDQARGIVLTIAIAARSVDDVDEFMERLDATGAFRDLLPRTERVTDDNLLEATLETVYDASGEPPAEAAGEAEP